LLSVVVARVIPRICETFLDIDNQLCLLEAIGKPVIFIVELTVLPDYQIMQRRFTTICLGVNASRAPWSR